MKYRTIECPACRASGEYCDQCHNGYIAIPDLNSSGPALWMVLVVGALVVIALVTWVTR